MTRRLLVALVVALAADVRAMYAQAARGTVVDRETGAAIRGVKLVLRDESHEVVTRMVSDSAGRFLLPALNGFFVLEASTAAHEQLGYASSLSMTLPDTALQVVRLPSAESVAAGLCDSPGGIVVGSVRTLPDSAAGASVSVRLEWDEPGGGQAAARRRGSIETTTNAGGRFRFCGTPVATPLIIRVLVGAESSATQQVSVPSNGRLASIDVVATPSSAMAVASTTATGTGAVLSGVVRNEKGHVVAEAEVLLPKLERNTFTNEQGEFRLADVAPGSHDLTVRRIGYREHTDSVEVALEGTAREIVLSAVTTLDTVAVTASAVIPSFEENRYIGLGKFLTRAELEKQEHRKMAEILQQVGAGVLRNGGRAWVGSGNRGVRSMANRGGLKCAQLEGREVRPGQPNPGCGCFAQVYINEALVYSGEAGQIVPDVNMISPASIEAIEYYKGPAQTPLRYSRLNSECGVLVLHTRRTPGGKP